MIEILKLARDVRKFSQFRRSNSSVETFNLIKIIDSVASIDVKLKPNIDFDIINLACKISNLEPTVTTSAGTILTLPQIRARGTFKKEELSFVQKKLWEYHDIFGCDDRKLHDAAVHHLLLGSAVTSDKAILEEIVVRSVLVPDIVENIAFLIGYAIAFNCVSVAKLADLFAFHYVDRLEQAKEHGMVSYMFDKTSYESLVI